METDNILHPNNEIVSLNELRSEIEHRNCHIAELWKNTAALNQGKQYSITNDSMLLSLIGKEHCPQFIPTSGPEDNTDFIKVCDMWKKIWQKTLIVGVEVKNTSKTELMYIAITMVQSGNSDRAVLTFQSDCYDLEKTSKYHSSHQYSKRRKISPASLSNFIDKDTSQLMPGKTVTILCTTSVPSFTSLSDIKFELFLHFTDSSECKCNSVIHIGDITLSALEILRGDNSIIVKHLYEKESNAPLPTELQRDILALNAAQICTPLCIKSTRFPLQQLPSWLQNKAGVVPIEKYECMVLCNIQQLEGVRIYFDDVVDGKELPMTAYTSCKDQLYLLLQHLYSVLPDDVIMVPTNQIQHLSSQLLDSLQEELSVICSGISHVSERSKYSDDIEMKEEQDENGSVIIENVRQNFAKRKLLIQNKSKLAMNGEELGQLSDNIEKLQLKSDISLIKLTS